jgi:sulfur-oxidizing protein SoxY
MCAWCVMPADAPTAQRRALMRGGLLAALAASGLFGARQAAAADDPAFGATSMQDTLAALGGVAALGSEVVLTVPDSADNGAVVPVSVTCSLPDISEIYVVVESNPNPMVVRFSIPEGTMPAIATRVKMAESSNVYAVVRSQGRLVSACKHTSVAVGGCG